MNWDFVKPIAAQFLRDFLRTVGMALLSHGAIKDGAGVEAFVGAGMTFGGLIWGWWTTTGHLQLEALLKKLTDTKTASAAVAVAKEMPAAVETGAAIDAKNVIAIDVAKVAVKVLLVAFLLSAFLAVPSAQAQGLLPKPRALTGDIVRDIQAATPTRSERALTGNPLGDIIGALDVKLLPDLQYALKLATASGSRVTGPCYQAWIDIINTRQKAVQDDQGQAQAMPDPHIVTDFEKLVELRNSLQPDSEFMIKCSPVASMVKKDIVGFIGVVLSGGAGLATLVPGL